MFDRRGNLRIIHLSVEKMKPEILIPTNGFKGHVAGHRVWGMAGEDAPREDHASRRDRKPEPGAIDDHHPLEEVFEYAVGLFSKSTESHTASRSRTEARRRSFRKAGKHGDLIVVLGPLGRPQIRRLLSGRSIRHFIEEIEQPILYVPESKLPIKKILICIGGLGYEVTAENLAIQIASKSRAEITLLHIVPPINLEYPTAKTVRDNWQRLEDTDTPVGRSLRQALEIAKADGLTAAVKGRQGNVVEEIWLNQRREIMTCCAWDHPTACIR
jgi:hypothetical protein